MRFLLLLVLTCASAAAQVAIPYVTPQMERGRVLLDEMVEALGGEAFLSMRNKVEFGRAYSFYQEKLSGLSKVNIYTKYLVAPEKPDIEELYLRERQAFGGKGKEKWAILYTEADAWEITFRGVKPLHKEAIERFLETRQREIFYLLLRRRNEPGMIFEHKGTEVVDNKPMELLNITDSKNRVITVYIHTSSKLPYRQLYARRDEDGFRHEELAIYGKYRDVGGGVMLPFVVQRHRDGEKDFSMFAESVEINQDLTDEKFSFPGDAQVLDREKK